MPADANEVDVRDKFEETLGVQTVLKAGFRHVSTSRARSSSALATGQRPDAPMSTRGLSRPLHPQFRNWRTAGRPRFPEGTGDGPSLTFAAWSAPHSPAAHTQPPAVERPEPRHPRHRQRKLPGQRASCGAGSAIAGQPGREQLVTSCSLRWGKRCRSGVSSRSGRSTPLKARYQA